MGNLGVKTDRCHRKLPEVAKFGVNLGRMSSKADQNKSDFRP